MDKDMTSVSLPADLVKRLEEKMKETEFQSVGDYIAKLLEDAVPAEAADAEGMSEEDEEKVKERLKALGYMD